MLNSTFSFKNAVLGICGTRMIEMTHLQMTHAFGCRRQETQTIPRAPNTPMQPFLFSRRTQEINPVYKFIQESAVSIFIRLLVNEVRLGLMKSVNHVDALEEQKINTHFLLTSLCGENVKRIKPYNQPYMRAVLNG